MRFILLISFIITIPAFGLSATIKVPGDYPTIQQAINAAVTGDTVLVDPGTYIENIDFIGKAISVISSAGFKVTIIDGNQTGSVVIFKNGESKDSIIEGFTLTNGSGTINTPWGRSGGGIYCFNASPTISTNHISFNLAKGYGGGIYCNDSSPIIIDNTISCNTVANYSGGGIYCNNSSPFISSNTILDNSANSKGGGIYCIDSSPFILSNTILVNSAKGSGGGIYCKNLSSKISNNVITGNLADNDGGGVFCSYSSPTISNCIFSENKALNSGGGIYCHSNFNPMIDSCKVLNNTATNNYGGGIYMTESSFPMIINCVIEDNSGNNDGGGIYSNLNDNPNIINCTVANNNSGHGGGINVDQNMYSNIVNCIIKNNKAGWGGGVYARSNIITIFINNTIYGNVAGLGLGKGEGGGIFCYGDSITFINNTVFENKANYAGGVHCKNALMNITNSIHWNNEALNLGTEFRLESDSSVTVSYSNIYKGQAGIYVGNGSSLNWRIGMMYADPLFIDPVKNDLHLTYLSPCKDTGDNSAVTELTDFEADPRIAYGTVDMGADEFYTHLYWTGDATPGGNVEVKLVGLPGTIPVGLCIGIGVLDPPLKSMWGDWYLQFPIIGPIKMPQIPTTGVLFIPGTIPGTPPTPYTIPMQSIIGVELTNLCIMNVE